MKNNFDTELYLSLDNFYKIKYSIEKIQFILGIAILAPSTHNTQPWMFKLTENSCQIYINPNLKLKYADPTEKNLFISIGCLIENIIIVSNYFGVYKELNYLTDNKINLVAEILFKDLDVTLKSVNLSSLIFYIPKRITFRGVFDSLNINKNILKEIRSANNINGIYCDTFENTHSIHQLAELTKRGILTVANNKGFRTELANWMRSNFTKKKDGLPGYSYGHSNLFSIFAPRLMKLINPSKIMAQKSYQTINSSKLVCVISSDNDCVTDWLNTGRIAQRVLLINTKNNLKTTISVAGIDANETRQLIMGMTLRKKNPQFLFCAGYNSDTQKSSPRYSVYERTLKN